MHRTRMTLFVLGRQDADCISFMQSGKLLDVKCVDGRNLVSVTVKGEPEPYKWFCVKAFLDSDAVLNSIAEQVEELNLLLDKIRHEKGDLVLFDVVKRRTGVLLVLRPATVEEEPEGVSCRLARTPYPIIGEDIACFDTEYNQSIVMIGDWLVMFSGVAR